MSVVDEDTADARILGVRRSGFDVFAQEETSSDQETDHAAETVGYLAFENGFIRDEDGTVVGEVGLFSFDQDKPNTWFQFTGRAYSSPVVMVMPNTNSGDPFHIRLDDVIPGSFKFKIEEWDYSDGIHGTERVAYLILEKGRHTLSDGTVLAARTVSTNHNFKSVSFSTTYSGIPAVLSQCQTFTGPQAIVTRMKGVTTSSIQVRLQEEEANDDVHFSETIAVIAYGPPA